MQINPNILNKAKGILQSTNFKDELKSKIKSNNVISEEVINDLKEDVIIIEDGLNKEVFTKEIVKEFVDFVKDYLNLDIPIKVTLSDNREGYTTFAYYQIGTGMVYVYCLNRHILDCFRSLSHEVVHIKQDSKNEITDDNSGTDNDGNDIENEANAKAGEIIRKWGKKHPELYDK